MEKFKDITHIIIDEFSLLNLKMLARMDRTLRQAKQQFDKPFGGLSIILAGDFYQLPPIEKHPLYVQITNKNKNKFTDIELEGKQAY